MKYERFIYIILFSSFLFVIYQTVIKGKVGITSISFLYSSFTTLILNHNKHSERSISQLSFKTDPYNLPIINETIKQSLPEHYDAREAYPYCESIREIRDQANCGACWAFAVAEVISDRICILSKGKQQPKISPLHLMTCCSTCIFDEDTSCLGGFLQGGFAYWESYGIPTGGTYNDKATCKPYFLPPCDHYTKGPFGFCNNNVYKHAKCEPFCQSGYRKAIDSDLYYAESIFQITNDEKAIMTEIYTNGPVTGYYQLYEDFFQYTKGVYQHHKGNNIGGHAIKIIGWGIENKVKYWIVANSWNKYWGEEGFFKILRGSNHCGIEEQIVAGIPKLLH